MPSQLKISLPDDLASFVSESSGEGTLFATSEEFVQDALRQAKRRQDANRAREGILNGYTDALQGNTIDFDGDLRKALSQIRTAKSDI